MMKKSKYVIYADCVEFASNSRNARRHLEQTGAGLVIVCKPDGKTEISRAVRHVSGLVLVGAHKGV